MQFYVGRQEEGPEPLGDRIYDEHMLPFAYWFSLRRWLPREFFDPNGPEKLVAGEPLIEAVNMRLDVRSYTAVCMNCHNTTPYAYRIFHRNYAGFLGATVATAIHPLSKALSPHVDVAPFVEDFVALNSRLDPDVDLVTVGISCESCHFGGREHVERQRQIRFLPSSPFTKVIPYRHDPAIEDSRYNSRTVLGICVQCHSGTGDFYAKGTSKGNSREAIDMHLGACTSQLRCVDCHDPHTAGGDFGTPANRAHAEMCTKCHSRFKDPETVQKHSRHSESTGVSCLDCHMPRQTQGLQRLVRSHRIGPPVEAAMVASGAVNACNLCHLDKPLQWTLDQLEDGWQHVIRIDNHTTTVDLSVPVKDLWLNSEDAALRLVAVQRLADSTRLADTAHANEYLAEIVRALNDEQPINRVFAQFALCRALGIEPEQFDDLDIAAPPSERAKQLESLQVKLYAGHPIRKNADFRAANGLENQSDDKSSHSQSKTSPSRPSSSSP
jgi:hypothetical protein